MQGAVKQDAGLKRAPHQRSDEKDPVYRGAETLSDSPSRLSCCRRAPYHRPSVDGTRWSMARTLMRLAALGGGAVLVGLVIVTEVHGLAHPCDGERTPTERWWETHFRDMLEVDGCCALQGWPRLHVPDGSEAGSGGCQCRCTQREARGSLKEVYGQTGLPTEAVQPAAGNRDDVAGRDLDRGR